MAFFFILKLEIKIDMNIKNYRKKYYEKNKEKIKNYHKKYYKKNKEKIKNYKKKYREKNKEKIKLKMQEYWRKNKEKLKEKRKEKRKEYYKKNKERINKRNREYKRKYVKTFQGKLNVKKNKFKRRQLNFFPLNKWTENRDGHHINKTCVIFIPREVHQSIHHNVWTGANMNKINNLAFKYLLDNDYKFWFQYIENLFFNIKNIRKLREV